jgi:hypothetical protein
MALTTGQQNAVRKANVRKCANGDRRPGSVPVAQGKLICQRCAVRWSRANPQMPTTGIKPEYLGIYPLVLIQD